MPSHLAQEFRELNKHLEDLYNRLGRVKKEKPKPPKGLEPKRDKRGGGLPIQVPGSGQTPGPEPDIKGIEGRGGNSTPQSLACACESGNRDACAQIAKEIAQGNDPTLYRCRKGGS